MGFRGPIIKDPVKGVKRATEQNRTRSDQRERDIARRAAEYGMGSGLGTGFTISGTQDERDKAIGGLEFAQVGYGQNIFDTGRDIAGIRDRLKERSAQSDPISEAIRNQKAGAVANAQRSLASQGVKGGAATAAISNVERQNNADVAASLYGQQRQSIADERSLASNTLAGTTALMQGSKAEGTPIPNAPQPASFMDSVICTELNRQGILSDELYKIDSEFGEQLKTYAPNIVVGYHLWAKPLVKLMRKSSIVTSILALPALQWARYIAGESNFIGFMLFQVGAPLCGLIGSIKLLGDRLCSRAQ
jgi:hypothetical protein